MSPLEQVVRDSLRQPGTRFAPDLDRSSIARAVATIGVGLSHFDGERVLASFAEKSDPSPPFAGFLVTGRRLLAPGVSAPLDAIVGAQASGVTAEVHTTVGSFRVRSAAAEWIAYLMNALTRLAPALRAEPSTPVLVPSLADPTGLHATLSTLVPSSDGTSIPLLQFLASPAAQGIPQAARTDLATRAVLAHRTHNRGRGMQDGWWLSPLPTTDMVFLIELLLGAAVRPPTPDAYGTQLGRISTLLDRMRSAAAHTTVETWIDRVPRAELEFRFANFRGFGAFLLQAVPPSTPTEGWHRHVLFELLPPLEARLLVLRTLFGWTSAPVDAWNLGAAQIRERAKEARATEDLLDLALPRLPQGTGIPTAPATQQDLGPAPASPPRTPEPSAPEHSAPAPTQPDLPVPAEDEDEPAAFSSPGETLSTRDSVAPPASGREAITQQRALAASRWLEATASGVPEAMEQAARGLGETALALRSREGFDEAYAAFELIAARFPGRKADAVLAMGDCCLFGALARGAATSDDVPLLERALKKYREALYLGTSRDAADDRFWQTCSTLARLHTETKKKMDCLTLYRTTYANGAHIADAEDELDHLRPWE